MKKNENRLIQCIGCECECQVSIECQDGHLKCLGGNNCPTGEIYALAQCKDMLPAEQIEVKK